MIRKNSTLIVKKIDKDTNLKMLLDTFIKYGEMNGIRIRSSKTDKLIILGFIEYKSINEATEVLEKIKNETTPLKINNNEVEVDYAISQSQNIKNAALIKGIEYSEIKNEELIKLLGCLKLKKINENIIAYYKTYSELKKALNDDNKILNGKKIIITKK